MTRTIWRVSAMHRQATPSIFAVHVVLYLLRDPACRRRSDQLSLGLDPRSPCASPHLRWGLRAPSFANAFTRWRELTEAEALCDPAVPEPGPDGLQERGLPVR